MALREAGGPAAEADCARLNYMSTKTVLTIFTRRRIASFAVLCAIVCLLSGFAGIGLAPDALAADAGEQEPKSDQEKTAVEEVEEMIASLAANPTAYTAADRSRVEAIQTAYENLSPAEQAQVDADEGHSETSQSYGRVLELALWMVRSYDAIDNSTILPNGIYSATTKPELKSEYSKGKSTSARQKPWSVKSVNVVDGKAFATITVESDTYPSIWMGGVTYPKVDKEGDCEFANVPIDLNSTFYFAGVSSTMPIPIAFSLTTSIDETAAPEEPQETPYEKAIRLIEALPTDPDAMSEEHWDALDEAQAAYDALTEVEQRQLDEEYPPTKNVTYGRWLESAQWGRITMQAVDSSLDLADGDYSKFVTSESNMGKSTSKRKKRWLVVKLTVSGGKAQAVIRCDQTSEFKNMRMGGIDYPANTVDGVPEFTVPFRVNDTVTFTVDANDNADSIAVQIQSTLPLNQATAEEVAAAKSSAQATLSADLSGYVDEGVKAIRSAANALMALAQKAGVTVVELNAASQVVNDAIANAEKKTATDSTEPSPSSSSASSSSASSTSPEKEESSSSKVSDTAKPGERFSRTKNLLNDLATSVSDVIASRSPSSLPVKSGESNSSGASSEIPSSGSSTPSSNNAAGSHSGGYTSQSTLQGPSYTQNTTKQPTSSTTTTAPTAGQRAAVPAVSATKSSSSAASSQSSQSSASSASASSSSSSAVVKSAGAANASTSAGGQTSASTNDSSASPSIREVSPSVLEDSSFQTKAIIAGLVVALVLVGMCSRTMLFLRGKGGFRR